MQHSLCAVVIGAGYSGEGHPHALRYAGVGVVAICARRPAVVQSVAERLKIPQDCVIWRHTLETLKPDISCSWCLSWCAGGSAARLRYPPHRGGGWSDGTALPRFSGASSFLSQIGAPCGERPAPSGAWRCALVAAVHGPTGPSRSYC